MHVYHFGITSNWWSSTKMIQSQKWWEEYVKTVKLTSISLIIKLKLASQGLEIGSLVICWILTSSLLFLSSIKCYYHQLYGKIYVYSTFIKSHLWDYIGYVIIIIVAAEYKRVNWFQFFLFIYCLLLVVGNIFIMTCT